MDGVGVPRCKVEHFDDVGRILFKSDPFDNFAARLVIYLRSKIWNYFCRRSKLDQTRIKSLYDLLMTHHYDSPEIFDFNQFERGAE